ncbi:MAG: RNA polymerase sigma factor [Firmicutes bacterium]|nr:RNA polymerase sigma factor [Bacillota bacterium]
MEQKAVRVSNAMWQEQREDYEAQLQAMVEQMGPRLYRLAVAMLANRDAADDVVQECFVRYWRHLESHPGRELGPGWLMRVTARLCLDEGRRRQRQQTAMQRWQEWHRLTSSDGEDPADEQLMELILGLKPKDRLAVVLVYYQDLSLTEAASILGTTPTFLKTKLGRIRRRLKTEWERGQ